MPETVVDIPGGTATLRDPAQLTVRQRRPLQVLVASFGQKRFEQVVTAQGDEDDPDALENLHLTESEWDAMFKMTDATIWSLLGAWTRDGVEQPLPATVEAVGDLPGEVYDALTTATAKVQAAHMAATAFGPDGMEEPNSPTGPSET